MPRLNLPRPDPNDQWREMLAQAQSYEDVSSSNKDNVESSSINNFEEESEEEYDAEEEESEYDSESRSVSR